MIQAIRDRITGWFAIVVVAFLAFVVGIWGIGSYFAPAVENYVAKVNDKEIDSNVYQARLNDYRNQMQSMMGEGFDPRYFEGATVKREFLDNLVRQELLQQNATAAGLVAPRADIQKQINEIAAFQVEGKFNGDVYKSVLSRQGMTPIMFEGRLKEESEVNRVPESLRDSSFVTDAEVDLIAKLRDQKRSARFIELSAATLRETLKPTDAEVKKYYDAHPNDFMSTETVAVDYIDLKAEDFNKDIVISDVDLQARFEREKARFGTPERRLASHILIATVPNATPEQQKAAADKAGSILQQLKDGAKFADLAKKVSEDPGSKDQGGDLGFIEPNGTMEKPFEEALFALKAKGDLSEPVSTRFGYHLIELRDIEATRQKTFIEVKDQLAEEDRKEQADRKFLDISGDVVDESEADSSALDAVAKKFKLEVKQLEPFSQAGGTGLAANRDLVEAAFSEDVIKAGYNSRPVMITDSQMVVLRLREHKPSVRQPLDQVRPLVVSRVIDEQVVTKLREQAKGLATRAKAGEKLEAFAADAKPAEIVAADAIARTGSSIDATIVLEIFKLDRPATGKMPITLVTFAEGKRFALVELQSVVDGDPTKLTKEERDQLKEQLSSGASSAETSALVAALREKATIVVKDDML